MALQWAGCGDGRSLGKISYVVIDSNSKTTLFTISPDGKTKTPVSITIPDSVFFVQPNKDATEVVYCRDEDNTGALELYLMGADNQEKQLTHSDTDGQNCYAAFSHDGKKIIFNSDRDTYVQVYSMNPDGTGQTRLITSEADDIFPKYSPDDSSFAFMRANSGVNSAVATMQGLKAQTLVASRQRSATFRAHSKLKASVTSTGDGIYKAKTDGSNPALVLSSESNNGFYYFSAPVFSIDGKRILFSTAQFNDYAQIASVKLDGSDLKNLSNSESDDYAPLPYGNQIMFNRNLDGQVEIFSMNTDGSSQKNLTNTTDTDEYLPDFAAYF